MKPFRSAIMAGFAKVFAGSTAAQIVTVLALPVLSRLYTPEAFGVYAFATAVVGFALPMSTLQLQVAAMLPSSIREVRAIVWNGLLAVFVSALLVPAVMYTLAAVGVEAYPSEETSLPLWVAAILLLAGTFLILSQLALRQELFGVVGRTSVMRSFVTAVAQCGAGLITNSPVGLVSGIALGNVSGIGSLTARSRHFLKFPGFRAMRLVWRKYWRYPAIFAPSSLLNTFGLHAPLIYMTATFGLSTAGQLGMAERVVALPLALVGAAASQVIDAEASKRMRTAGQPLFPLFVRLSAVLAAPSALLAAVLLAAGPELLPLILGSEWETAGTFTQVLAITAAVRLVASPTSRFILLMQRARAVVVLDVLRFALVVLSFIAASSLALGPVDTAWLVYSAMTFTYAVTWIYTAVATSRRDRLSSNPNIQ